MAVFKNEKISLEREIWWHLAFDVHWLIDITTTISHFKQNIVG